MKRNDILIHITIQRKLEYISAKESQTQKVTYCMIHLYEMSRTGKFIETESRVVAARD